MVRGCIAREKSLARRRDVCMPYIREYLRRAVWFMQHDTSAKFIGGALKPERKSRLRCECLSKHSYKLCNCWRHTGSLERIQTADHDCELIERKRDSHSATPPTHYPRN